MTIIDWMMNYPYLSATVIVMALFILATVHIEIKIGNPAQGLWENAKNKNNKKENSQYEQSYTYRSPNS